MNPANKDTEFLWRRLTESFEDWSIGLPVLFAFLILFIVATFRREKGIAALFWTLGLFFLVPLAISGRTTAQTDVVANTLREVLAGIIFAGFVVYLAIDNLPVRPAWWLNLLAGVFLVGVDIVWNRLDLSLPVKLAPVAFLFLVQVFLTAWRARMLWAFGIVLFMSAAYLPLAVMFKPAFSWWVILGPMLGAALFYVGLMYIQDAKSIHPAWAGFLGLLRCTVYAILAFVFLLPGCQSYDTAEFFPKILLLFDVSGSMNTKDDLLEPGQKPETLLTRQDKVLHTLTSNVGPDGKSRPSFLEQLAQLSPGTIYRFGSIADDHTLKLSDKEGMLSAAELKKFLHPDKKDIGEPEKGTAEDKLKYRARMNDLYDSLRGGTNVPGSALQVARAEAANYVQAIILFSDGQSNLGDATANIKEYSARVNNPKRPIKVFTVGVGAWNQPAEIRIDDLQTAQTARPDDKFPARVRTIGTGLAGEEFDVVLDVRRVKDSLGNPLPNEKGYTLPAKKGKFKGAGDYPQDTVEFEVDLQDLKKIKATDDKGRELEGEWEIVARVPRHARESFTEPEHVSNPPTRVQVQNKELRILLFAGGPTRDYQFIRTLLYREVLEKRMEMSVFLQQDVSQDVDQDVLKERLLTHFPNRMGQDDPADKYSSLNMYDVIIAVDPDWTALDASQVKMLEQWIARDAGGLIFIAGPVNTFQLARSRPELDPLKNIIPVYLRDFRLTPGGGVDTNRPYVLNFTPRAKTFDFLKLDESEDNAFAGWDKFFWGDSRKPAGNDPRPLRGVYNYYPVEKIRDGSTVLATFGGPEATRINDGKDEHPYLVAMPYGAGKALYIGSGETWRLRQFKESFHERLWIKMARFAAAGSTQKKKHGQILLGRKVPTGVIGFEAQIKGADLLPMPRDAKPVVLVKKRGDHDAKPETFELRAKATQGDWYGWFTGSFKAKEAGEYEFTIPIPNTTETLNHTLEVFKPNLEEANVRENHKELYQLATDAAPVLAGLPQETRKEIERILQPVSEDIRDGKEGTRLFFTLKNADSIPKYLRKLDPRRERTKGALKDLWDRGSKIEAYWFLLIVPLLLGGLAFAILLYHERYLWSVVVLAGAVLFSLTFLLVDLAMEPTWIDVDFSFVLITVVSLLAVEWLTRKLLRLA